MTNQELTELLGDIACHLAEEHNVATGIYVRTHDATHGQQVDEVFKLLKRVRSALTKIDLRRAEP